MIYCNNKWAYMKKNKHGLYVLYSWNVWKQKWTAHPGSTSFSDLRYAAKCAKEASDEIENMFLAHGVMPAPQPLPTE